MEHTARCAHRSSPALRLFHRQLFQKRQQILSTGIVLTGKANDFPGLYQQRPTDGSQLLLACAPGNFVRLGGNDRKRNTHLAQKLVHGHVVCRGRMADVHQMQNALQVLDAYNLQESDFTPEYLSFSESAQAMKEGKIDAAFITAAIPTPAVTNLADSIGVRVLSIDPFAVNVLTKRHSYYTPCTIPANTYAGQSEVAQTVGVRAVVVARNDMPEDQVKSIMQLLFNGQIPFAEKLKSSMQPTLEEATEGIPIAFHPGAAAYYADNDITVDVMNSSDEGKSVSGGQDD